MKYVKMFGVAAVAALALMAVAGAGTASAKVCSNDELNNKHTPKTACVAPHGSIYNGVIHTQKGKANATLTSSFVTVTCDSTTQGTSTNGTLTKGVVKNLEFVSCTSAQASNCSATATASESSPWEVSVAATGGGNGTLEVSNVGGQFTCTVFGIKTTCIYADATVGDKGEIVITGGKEATVKATNVQLTRQAGSGFGCSEVGTWSGNYSLTTPSDLFVT